jgi:hypothetical protein
LLLIDSNTSSYGSNTTSGTSSSGTSSTGRAVSTGAAASTADPTITNTIPAPPAVSKAVAATSATTECTISINRSSSSGAPLFAADQHPDLPLDRLDGRDWARPSRPALAKLASARIVMARMPGRPKERSQRLWLDSNDPDEMVSYFETCRCLFPLTTI